MIAFDLDGCLIDSEDLIRQAYRDAGAEPPAGFLALGHHAWIEGDRETVHARKDAAYLRRIATDPLTFLPPWQAALSLREAGQVTALITGAPDGTVVRLWARKVPWPFTVFCDGLTPAGKTAWLASAGRGVYVDDQQYVTMPDGWRFVHYTGQDISELCRQVTCR